MNICTVYTFYNLVFFKLDNKNKRALQFLSILGHNAIKITDTLIFNGKMIFFEKC